MFRINMAFNIENLEYGDGWALSDRSYMCKEILFLPHLVKNCALSVSFVCFLILVLHTQGKTTTPYADGMNDLQTRGKT
jgi:hypothetical protein